MPLTKDLQVKTKTKKMDKQNKESLPGAGALLRLPEGIQDFTCSNNARVRKQKPKKKNRVPSDLENYISECKEYAEVREALRINIIQNQMDNGKLHSSLGNAEYSENPNENKFTEDYLDLYTAYDEELENRNFVTMSVHSIPTSECGVLPMELAIVAFNLENGIKNDYWSLVDPHSIPLGYGDVIEELVRKTGLPMPGQIEFKLEHRDYFRILDAIRRYILTFVSPYFGYFAVFLMPDDLLPACGSIQWLVENAYYVTPQEESDVKVFFSKVKFCKLTSLFVRLAKVAKAIYPSFVSPITECNYNERAAEELLNQNKLELGAEELITCSFHVQDSVIDRMHECCRYAARKRVYILLQHLIACFKLDLAEGHFAKYSKRPQPYEEL